MEINFINYYEVLGLKKGKLATNKVLDAYLEEKNTILFGKEGSSAEKDEQLSILNEALTVIMSKELKAVFDIQLEKHSAAIKAEETQKNQTPIPNRLMNVPARTLFESLIAYEEGRADHQLNMIPRCEIERELAINRLWAMHVIKEIVATKKFPKSLK